MTKNWKSYGNPFLEFTEETTQEWINKGFNKEQCREWLNVGINSVDAGFCRWIRDITEETPESILNAEVDLTELREQYAEYLEKNPETEEEIVPDWLFPEETEKPTKPNKKQKLPKPFQPSPKSNPHECRICEKNIFYTKAEYIQAHGRGQHAPSVWVWKSAIIRKNPIIIKSMWICKICKQTNHTDKCKYYSPVKPIIPIPEPFDWESYWKWWFGVNTLDWDSKRFFG